MKLGSTFYLNNEKEINYFNLFKKLVKDDYKNISEFYKENIKKYVILKYLYKIKKELKEANKLLEIGLKSENIYINFKDDEFFLTPNNTGVDVVFNKPFIAKFEKNELIEIFENLEYRTKEEIFKDIKKYIIDLKEIDPWSNCIWC
ncbi:MAG: hypothetical protein PHX44_03085 [Sulfurimonas sp.]|uniref:hypothetical protein n=1 Tax=Sulfurimonas sp. TaxID=2022749 RepID=UPI0026362A13|nr:hypothetical protein [Sulfurimonas sp.]MDD2652022.1 hypothetical protein [Sulfurimonas sp.]MDD3451852.1 hypothetical protein [Sulfurimonas sp.]